MKFTFLGTSAGVPTKKRNVTGLAIGLERDKGWCLVDCGEGTQQQILYTPYSLANLEVIFITHVHGDHCYGLPGILASAGMAGRKLPLKIVGPAPLEEFIEVMLRTTDCYIPYDIEFIATEQIIAPIDVAGFQVKPFKLSHRVPCHAWRFTEINIDHKLNIEKLIKEQIPRGPIWGQLCDGDIVTHEGRTLTGREYWLPNHHSRKVIVAGDNDQPGLLHQAALDVDVLIHEATYCQTVADKVGDAPMHSSAKMVADFAEQVKLENLVLTHFSARYGGNGENSIDTLRQEAKESYNGNLYLANDFETYQLKKDGKLVLLKT